jgi:CubicO group peptidase (beta-lactamase class C family)
LHSNPNLKKRFFPFLIWLSTGLRLAVCAQNTDKQTALAALESRIQQGITHKEYPGAVMVVIHHGKPILRKGWGETAYGSGKKPSPEYSLYDLASLTKAIGTSTSLMRLYDEGRFHLEDSLGTHLPDAKGQPLGNIRIQDLLAHRTGLPPYYISNYWLYAKNRWDNSFFSKVQSESFPDPFRGMFLPKSYRIQMFRDLAHLPFRGKPRTVYSDLNYALLGSMVEAISGMRLDLYLEKWLFSRMKLRKTCFNPLLHSFTRVDVIPTMADSLFHGWVHDPEAGKLGGVCGAAGLFSTANEVAIIGEMLLSGGSFHGEQLIKSETIKEFAWQIKPGYLRAMGWQKPPFTKGARSIAPPQASSNAFGHTGHTGSLLWVDPEKNLVVVFLANLTYPKDAPSSFTMQAGYRQILNLIYHLL